MKSELIKQIKEAFPKNPKATTFRETFQPHKVSVQYHDTIIAEFNLDTFELVLDTGEMTGGCGGGGFRENPTPAIGTVTTRKKINQFLKGLGLRAHVSQNRYKWFIAGKEWKESKITLQFSPEDFNVDYRPTEMISEDYYTK